ncbi:MAG: ABC transporter ATP-binding protein [Planctomycetes bacterium]|nr:ABC transporter ATP-binding protein [Planctomycetota bacterium]
MNASTTTTPVLARPAVLAAHGVRKSFRVGDRELEVLHGVDFTLAPGEILALTGPSGAGKSTLLHILGLLDRPTSGTVTLDDASAWELPNEERARLRNRKLGFVFQFYHLISELTALENVLLPAMVGESTREYRSNRTRHEGAARGMLASFGLSERLTHRPAQLSGGERQRVALARALLYDPPIVIADEPTGNLDRATGERVLELLFREQAARKFSLLFVTHDDRLAARCERHVVMDDGVIQPRAAD